MKTIEISSKDNEKIKVLKRLGTKKYRNKLNKFLVENLAIIYDALRAGNQPKSLFITQELLNSESSKIKFVLDNINLDSIFIINENINKQFSSLETPSGITAVYSKKKSIKTGASKEVVYLNGINDPGNLGTILRSAVAFDINEIILDETCADLYNPKTIQSSKDAVFKLNIVFDKDLKVLKRIGKKMDILITDVDGGEGVSEALKNKKSFCVVLGSESHGVSDDIKKLSNKSINIKSDSEMESLNVAVSSGIILYEIYNRK